ncbi:hypothetical protein [Pseudomonas sp. BN515]|uniref:hypothetical protein n=1 Tax=Pseudomonas sp. BN515 TaxID=2567892 RepID=UPI002457FB5A|nr:hypothetical protein [Pseudomonas sp. BN515]MDH4871362.1 hypothetical protein [Pseudomonas sp. BN515]
MQRKKGIDLFSSPRLHFAQQIMHEMDDPAEQLGEKWTDSFNFFNPGRSAGLRVEKMNLSPF